VEFDSYLNAAYTDPNGNHVAIQTGGKVQNKPWHVAPYLQRLEQLPVALQSGEAYRMRVSYTPGRMDVYLNDQPVLTWEPVDLSTVINLDREGGAWIGITSATGKSSEDHEILVWKVDNCGLPTSVPHESEPSTSAITIAPNPAREFVRITVPTSTSACRITVLDLAGRTVMASDAASATTTMDISALPVGVYIVRVEAGSDVATSSLSIIR
jgi:hypothetical protein